MADFRDLVQDSTTVVGTSAACSITNVPIIGRRTFASTYTVGTTGIPYKIGTQNTGAEWEIGLGTLTSTTVFTRVTVLSSSNADALVAFSQGAKDIWVDAPASLLGRVDAYTTTPRLLGQRTVAPFTITGATAHTINAIGAAPGDSTVMFFNSDGVTGHVPTFTNAVASTADAGYLNSAASIENGCQIIKTPSQILYAFFQNSAGTPTATSPPNTPTIGTATAGNAAASVAFTPAAGPTATSFTATSSPGGITGSGASSPVTVPGLTNNTAYTFTVHGTNAVGNSPESAASNSVTPTASTGTITGTFIATGNVGSPYSSALATSGFSGTITPILASGTLPTGLTLGVSGSNITLTGTTTTTSGSPFTFTVSATGSTSGSATSGSQTVTVSAALTFAKIRLSTLTAGSSGTGITETGNGTAGWNYAGSGSGGTYGTVSANTSTLSLAASTDGELRWTLGTTDSSHSVMVFTASTNNQDLHATFANLLYMADDPGNVRAFKTDAGSPIATGPGTASGLNISVKRVGTSIIWSTSSDDVTYTPFNTITGETSVQLFVGAGFLGTGAITNLRGAGFA